MSQRKICPQCGAEFPPDQRFCPSDGSTLRVPGGAELVGSIVADRYHVVRPLGEGGMGQVYLAEHVKMGRRCALKVMNAAMVSDADAVSRFNREAANASRISHPNVAAVYDFGETPDGVIYLAMEFVDGPSLTQLIERQGALPPLRAAEIARQTAAALSAAHDLGIVHRDLKPDNIMLARTRDDADLVKVVDFGIAKAGDSAVQKVTRTGLVVGTPEYMSPEQLAGDTLDGRSDVYALGLVAFNMLTGRLPFPAATVQESLILRLTDAPKRLEEMKGDVGWTPAVQAVLDRALAREAAKRYASAREFGEALYEAVAAMPVSVATGMRTAVMEGRGARDEGRAGEAGRGRGEASRATSLPPTRIGRAPGRRRAGLLAGVAAVVVLGGAGTATFALERHGAPVPAPHDSTIAPQGSVATVADPRPAADAPAPSAAPNATPAAARRSAHHAAAPLPVATELTRLEALTDPDRGADAASARRAIAALDGLAPRLASTEDRIHAQVIRAEAHLALQDDAAACAILENVAPRAAGTTRQNRVTYLLGYACQ